MKPTGVIAADKPYRRWRNTLALQDEAEQRI